MKKFIAIGIPALVLVVVLAVDWFGVHEKVKHEMPPLKAVEPPMHPVIKDGVVVGYATRDDILPSLSNQSTSVSGNFYAPVTIWFGNDSTGNTLEAYGTKCHLEEMYSKINKDQIIDCEEFSIFVYDAKERHAARGVNH